jgi:hypothetical protein
VPAQDHRYGPFPARADPEHLQSSHKSVARSIPVSSVEASWHWIRSAHDEDCVVTVETRIHEKQDRHTEVIGVGTPPPLAIRPS